MKRFNILLVPNFVNSVAFLSRMSEIVSVDSRFVKRVRNCQLNKWLIMIGYHCLLNRLTLSLCSVLTDPLSARWGDDSLLFPYPYRKKIQEILRLKLTVTSSGVYAWSFLLMVSGSLCLQRTSHRSFSWRYDSMHVCHVLTFSLFNFFPLTATNKIRRTTTRRSCLPWRRCRLSSWWRGDSDLL